MMRYSRSWIRPGKWRSGESCIQSVVYSCFAPLAWLYSALDTDAGSILDTDAGSMSARVDRQTWRCGTTDGHSLLFSAGLR
jgi:hypothetical protein